MSEATEDQVAPGIGNGALPDLFLAAMAAVKCPPLKADINRKRKRAYFRAYESGYISEDILAFISKVSLNRATRALCERLYNPQYLNEPAPIRGLAAWLPEAGSSLFGIGDKR